MRTRQIEGKTDMTKLKSLFAKLRTRLTMIISRICRHSGEAKITINMEYTGCDREQ
jgi:hypothetical protein